MKFEQVKKSRRSSPEEKRCKVFFSSLQEAGIRERIFGKVSSSSWLYITNNIKNTRKSDLTCLFLLEKIFFWNISKMSWWAERFKGPQRGLLHLSPYWMLLALLVTITLVQCRQQSVGNTAAGGTRHHQVSSPTVFFWVVWTSV